MVADRRITTDAHRVKQLAPVVMSIMKQRKRMRYADIFEQTRAAVQTRVARTPALIKCCVEGLIDRNYLMRTVENGSSHLASSAVILEYMP